MNYRKLFLLFALCLLAAVSPLANAQYQMQVYGLWHCYDDACSWASVPNMTTFDSNNHWIIDRNHDNTFHPSVNVVVLSFVDPVKLVMAVPRAASRVFTAAPTHAILAAAFAPLSVRDRASTTAVSLSGARCRTPCDVSRGLQRRRRATRGADWSSRRSIFDSSVVDPDRHRYRRGDKERRGRGQGRRSRGNQCWQVGHRGRRRPV